MVSNAKRPALKPVTFGDIVKAVATETFLRIPAPRKVESDLVDTETPSPKAVLASMTRKQRREEFRREMREMKREGLI